MPAKQTIVVTTRTRTRSKKSNSKSKSSNKRGNQKDALHVGGICEWVII